MNFETLRHRVAQAEQAVVVRETRTRQQWTQLRTTWRTGWTPGRIVIAGLAAGFIVGRARPLRLAGLMKVAEGLTTVDEILRCTPQWTAARAAPAS